MKLSIITPVLNRAAFVERAIESVYAQLNRDWEHLIIDGGSNDGSLEVYKKYPHLKVSVEADRNVYDAFNKGILQSEGDIIGILNSDDYYETEILARVVEIFEQHPDLDMLSGGCAFHSNDSGCQQDLFRYVHAIFQQLNPRVLVRYPVMMNARFFRREVFEKVGWFDCDYPVVADREFLIRCSIQNLKNRVFPQIVCHYVLHQGALSHKPEGVGIKVLKENVFCARKKKNDAGCKWIKDVYEFWEAWSLFQLIIQGCRGKSINQVMQVIATDWVLLTRKLPQLLIQTIQHFRERNLKRS